MLKANLGIKKEDKLDWFELILKTLSAIGSEGDAPMDTWTDQKLAVYLNGLFDLL